MIISKKIIYGFSFLIIFTLIFSSATENIKAEGISLEKAIEFGLENSTEIEDIENKISEKVQETFEQSNIATKEDYNNLEEKIDQIQNTLEELKEKK